MVASGLATCLSSNGPFQKCTNPIKGHKHTSYHQMNGLESAMWHDLIGCEKREYSQKYATCWLYLYADWASQSQNFLLFGKMNRTWYLPHTTSVFRTVHGAGIATTRPFQSLRFGIVSSAFNFEHNTWSPYHTSPLGIFWTQNTLITCLEDEGATPLHFPLPSISPYLVCWPWAQFEDNQHFPT